MIFKFFNYEKNKKVSEKSEINFWCEIEIDLKNFEHFENFFLKLLHVDKNKTITVTINEKWINIDEKDVFYSEFNFFTNSRCSKSEDNYFFTFNFRDDISISSIKQNSHIFRKTLSEITQCYPPNSNPVDLYSSQIIYNFKFFQTSTTMNNYVCPFCKIDCFNFGGLTIHLKANHDRFAFQFSSEPLKVKVSINENFESSCESDKLMNSFYGFETNHQTPLRRKGVNFMLLSNEKLNYFLNLNEKVGNSCDLTELPSLFQENDYKRVYFRSQTCAPILPSEIDFDSEDEDFSDWLKQRTISVRLNYFLILFNRI